MSRSLALALSITDLLFLAYWLASGLDKVGLIAIPADWLYAGAGEPRVDAWNWSFFPLDLAFSVTGLAAVAASRKGSASWRPLALISLILTMVAGGMAVGYWTRPGTCPTSRCCSGPSPFCPDSCAICRGTCDVALSVG
jgi:hypothetical protein